MGNRILIAVLSICAWSASAATARATEKYCMGVGASRGSHFEMVLSPESVSLKEIKDNGAGVSPAELTYERVRAEAPMQGKFDTSYLRYTAAPNDLLVDQSLFKQGATGIVKSQSSLEKTTQSSFFCNEL